MWYVGIVVVAIVAVIVTVKILDKSSDLHLRITQTSPNTWHIQEPNNHPERYINRTCATKHMRVVQIQQPSRFKSSRRQWSDDSTETIKFDHLVSDLHVCDRQKPTR